MLTKRFQTRQVPKPQLSDRQRRILDFLRANPVAVLSTVGSNGEPHGVVVYYAIQDDFSIALLTRVRTRKCANLRHDARAMLTVFDPHTQTTAQVTGAAIEATDSVEVNAVAGAILRVSLGKNGAALLPITKLQAGPFTAFTIHPEQIRIARYGLADIGDYTDLFESIESFTLH